MPGGSTTTSFAHFDTVSLNGSKTGPGDNRLVHVWGLVPGDESGAIQSGNKVAGFLEISHPREHVSAAESDGVLGQR